ncbi:unnamed protein product [Euphydryas editha]|uniref:Uncharacterized protein n=1 Tax=Euphydryas editha TaxID=104508 RepID=A0AAU9UP42_EUPED|nr:unnamed protein product [Euphydryas editha]
MKQLSFELCAPWMRSRLRIPTLQRSLRENIEKILPQANLELPQEADKEPLTKVRRYCSIVQKKKKKTMSKMTSSIKYIHLCSIVVEDSSSNDDDDDDNYSGNDEMSGVEELDSDYNLIEFFQLNIFVFSKTATERCEVVWSRRRSKTSAKVTKQEKTDNSRQLLKSNSIPTISPVAKKKIEVLSDIKLLQQPPTLTSEEEILRPVISLETAVTSGTSSSYTEEPPKEKLFPNVKEVCVQTDAIKCMDPVEDVLKRKTLSSSVADALDFLRTNGNENFQRSETSSEYIRMIDRIFDLLNAKSPTGTGFKSPLRLSNEMFWTKAFTDTREYLKNLTIDSQNILTNRRKMADFGLIVDTYSCPDLAKDLLENVDNNLDYFRPYKLSQDHLEMFFWFEWQGGENNNPNALQFSSYRAAPSLRLVPSRDVAAKLRRLLPPATALDSAVSRRRALIDVLFLRHSQSHIILVS